MHLEMYPFWCLFYRTNPTLSISLLLMSGFNLASSVIIQLFFNSFRDISFCDLSSNRFYCFIHSNDFISFIHILLQVQIFVFLCGKLLKQNVLSKTSLIFHCNLYRECKLPGFLFNVYLICYFCELSKFGVSASDFSNYKSFLSPSRLLYWVCVYDESRFVILDKY